MLADPSRRWLYVALHDSRQIARYAIHPTTGALTFKGTLAVAAGPVRLATEPLGRFLFSQHDGATSDIASYRIDPADGSLVMATDAQFGANEQASGIVAERGGRRLFAASHGGLRQASIDPVTGALSNWSTVNALHADLAIDAVNQRLVAANPSPVALRSYSIDPATGAISSITGAWSQHDLPPGLVKLVATDPQGRYLFAFRADSIEAYAIDPATRDVTVQGGTTAAPVGAVSLPAGCHEAAIAPPLLAMDPSGRFLRVPCTDGSGRVFTLAIDRGTGALGVAGHVAAAADAGALETVDLGARLVFAARADGIGIHTVDPATGNLPEIAAPLVVSTPAPIRLAVNRAGQRLYAARPGAGIDTYAIGATGTLALLGSIAGEGQAAPVLDPGGRNAYVPNGEALSISRHGVGASGVLTPGSDYATDRDVHPGGVDIDPRAIVFHPSGRWAYVAHGGASGRAVSVFDVDPETGDLQFSALSAYPHTFDSVANAAPSGLAIDPTGRFLYAAGGSLVAGFRIDPVTGVPARTTQLIDDGGYVPGGAILSLTADPLGAHLYASTTQGVVVLSIDRSAGAGLAGRLVVAGAPVAGTTGELLVDSAGQRLYGASGGASLSSHALDRSGAAPVAGSATATSVSATVSALVATP